MKTTIALKINFTPMLMFRLPSKQKLLPPTTSPSHVQVLKLQPQPIWSHCPLETAIYLHLISQAEYCIIQFPVLPDV